MTSATTRTGEGAPRPGGGGARVLLFTDTFADVNGVARFLGDVADLALAQGRQLQVVTSTALEMKARGNVRNMAPVFSRAMPGYADLRLAIPPVRAMGEWARAWKPDAIHVSTPGPVGWTGWRVARRLGVPLLGVYHTDFPAYVDRLFDDAVASWACRRVMGTFYRALDRVFTRTAEYSRAVESLGVEPSRLVSLRPGIRIDHFHPRWRDRGDQGVVRVGYVGRVSTEKNLAMLARVWKRVRARVGARGELWVVGEGPYLAEMRSSLAGCGVTFVGMARGEALARHHANADLFVFPSKTDTLGQVVMEAQASGVPALVGDAGGPKEIVRDGETGLVLPADDSQAWEGALVGLIEDGPRRREMGRSARAWMESHSIERSFEHFWAEHERAIASRVGAS